MIGRDYYEQSAEASSRAGKEDDNDDEGTLEKGQEKEGVTMEDYKKTYWYHIEDFYQEYPDHDLAAHLQEKYEELIRVHGYGRIMYIEELIEREMLQTEEIEEVRKKAIAKISKQEIFEVVTALAFLAGIATGAKDMMKK